MSNGEKSKTFDVLKSLTADDPSSGLTVGQVNTLMKEFVPPEQHAKFQARVTELMKIKSMKMRDALGV